MQDERPAPRVSISDPNTPSGYGDVLRSGDERPPWRPNRGQLRVLLSVLLVLLVALPPTLWFKHRSDERAAYRQALAAVRFSLVEASDQPLFRFRNDGPAAVRVLSVRLERTGYPAVPVGLHVASRGILELKVPFEGPCPSALPRTGPSGIVLAVRTHRGGEREVRLDLKDTRTSLVFLDEIRQTCQLFEPEDSIELDSAGFDAQGRTLVVVVELRNRSVLMRRITDLRTGRGLHVTAIPALPLAVPPAVRGQQFGSLVLLTAKVTVGDCATARLDRDEVPDPFSDGFALTFDDTATDRQPAVLFLGDTYKQLVSDLVANSC